MTWLAPSVPLDLHACSLAFVAARLGIKFELRSETRWSGPPPGDPDPFSGGDVDLGFLCAPSYLRLAGLDPPAVTLVPAAPLFSDSRADGRPVYFSDVVVRADHPAQQLSDLVGSRWAYNDRTSMSGWFSVADLLDQAGELVESGSHLRSIELVRQGDADAAAIDSTVLARLDGDATDGLRIVETRGPWPIHPMVVSASLPEPLVAEMAGRLLTMHEDPLAAAQLRLYGVERWAPVTETDYLALTSCLP